MSRAYRCDKCGRLYDRLGEDHAPLVVFFSRAADVPESHVDLCPGCAEDVLKTLLEIAVMKYGIEP